MSGSVNRFPPSRRHAGFTLVEMLIVITIIAILSTFALPSYSTFVAAQRIRAASLNIMVMLTLARSEAIKRNALVTATPTNNNWSQGWTVAAADGTVVDRQAPLPGISLTCMQGTPLEAAACNSLTYRPNGRISGTAQSIQIQSSSIATEAAAAIYGRCINIDLSGRPGSKKGSC